MPPVAVVTANPSCPPVRATRRPSRASLRLIRGTHALPVAVVTSARSLDGEGAGRAVATPAKWRRAAQGLGWRNLCVVHRRRTRRKTGGRRPMAVLTSQARALLESDALAHLVTLNRDGSP